MAKETTKPTTQKQEPRRHRMVVGRQPLHEDGTFYAPGAEIEVNEARKKALGGFIKEAPAEEK